MSQSPEEQEFNISDDVISARVTEMTAAVGEVTALINGTSQAAAEVNQEPQKQATIYAYQDQPTAEVENFLRKARNDVNQAFSEGDLADAQVKPL